MEVTEDVWIGLRLGLLSEILEKVIGALAKAFYSRSSGDSSSCSH